ncbi:hypothetical protein [Robiginitalea sp. IMCC43444]|uniref:hypothetical protein n=1 Tax=Robiginitalea sp. IMCC43444 TaxID=3459121 RepID=UPI00404154B5
MKIKTIIGLSILVVFCSCKQVRHNSSENAVNSITESVSDNGILIQNHMYRGTEYTDSLGNNYKLRYIPITITNESGVHVEASIVFDKEYQYPNADEKFKVIPLPTEWAVEGKGITEMMRNELKDYINQPKMNLSLEPDETIKIGIGTLYPLPPQNGGIDVKALFLISDKTLYEQCKWLSENWQQKKPKKSLALKLDFEGCIIIPCGEFHFR